jgi:hypothetical protein
MMMQQQMQQQEMMNLRHQLEMQKQMIQKLQQPPAPQLPVDGSEISNNGSSGNDGSNVIGTYLHIPKNKDTLLMDDRGIMPDRAIKKVESQKSNSITNIAAQMAKERDAAISPPSGGISNPRIP